MLILGSMAASMAAGAMLYSASWRRAHPHASRRSRRAGGRSKRRGMGFDPTGSRHMTEHTNASTRASRVIGARPEEIYEAFMNPAALVAWLPPGEMTGEIHEFDARVGGGYRMSLFYPPTERSFRGKTSDREDRFSVRFVELAPPQRIVEAVSFATTDPAFCGEMTMTATFEEVSGGTEVTLVFENLPRAEDNAAGSRLSLEQLARRFE